MNANFMLPSFPKLETERLLLREQNPEDAKAIFALFSEPAVTQFHNLDTFIDIEEALRLIERQKKRFESASGIRWGIVRKRDNTLIGSCGFTWNKQTDSAEVGYELASSSWRQRIMTEALRAILRFGFEEIGLQFVVAEVMLDNTASKNLLGKLCFQSQGILKQHGFWKGKYHDLEQFVLTRTMTDAI
jgi:ribosomal-protein-alanine N-acetyltransferase